MLVSLVVCSVCDWCESKPVVDSRRFSGIKKTRIMRLGLRIPPSSWTHSSTEGLCSALLPDYYQLPEWPGICQNSPAPSSKHLGQDVCVIPCEPKTQGESEREREKEGAPPFFFPESTVLAARHGGPQLCAWDYGRRGSGKRTQ